MFVVHTCVLEVVVVVAFGPLLAFPYAAGLFIILIFIWIFITMFIDVAMSGALCSGHDRVYTSCVGVLVSVVGQRGAVRE